MNSSMTVSPTAVEAKKFNLDAKYVEGLVSKVSSNPKDVAIAFLGEKDNTKGYELYVDGKSYGFVVKNGKPVQPKDNLFEGKNLNQMIDFYK